MPVSHYENFPVASWLVPGRIRPAIVAIYNFARYADDIADEGDAAPAVRLAGLERCSRELDAIEQGRTPTEAPFAALAPVVRRYALPMPLLRDLVSAFSQDVVRHRYRDWDDLLEYCRRSANPIGRLLLHLYGKAEPRLCAFADAICTGLQLANFWQDAAVDWAKGRIYLPLADMERFGVTEQNIAAGRCDDAWSALVAFELERTRALFDFGKPLTRALPLRLAMELKLVIAGGTRILDKIDAVRGDVFRQRPTLARGDWLLMSRALLT